MCFVFGVVLKLMTYFKGESKKKNRKCMHDSYEKYMHESRKNVMWVFHITYGKQIVCWEQKYY